MKKVFFALSCLLFYTTSFAQTPLNDNNWILNTFLSDEFNGSGSISLKN